jgi:hypothetical protein
MPDNVVSNPVPGTAACPYNFNKPSCDMAEPQSPRDLSTGATGTMRPKASALTDAQANYLPLVNVHFHLGAEHKSDDYMDSTILDTYSASHRRLSQKQLEARRLATGEVAPGYMCDNSALSSDQLAPYNWQYCAGQMYVGYSYEVHYVHSSAGYTDSEAVAAGVDGIDDGLGGAANGRGLLNPMIVVQGQVYHIVNGGANVSDLLHGWTVVGHTNAVNYMGSTTGPSHTNEICSPFAITWHVDTMCHDVSPESFDNLCKQMEDQYGLVGDLYPHGSRILVDPAYVVTSDYVTPLDGPYPTPAPAR